MRPRLVLGTAGHIDHGKTALIRALTGVDTDRLPEEKARGITIDLGFAPLDLGEDLRLSVVDVPGHEGLVRTMVAGAWGIDLLLLVVAADEGVMPQTREHVAICDLLGIERGVVALTKADLADAEMAELAADEVRELLAGTALGDAPLVPVSSLTGRGLDALREALARAAAHAPPRTPRSWPPRLPIDRSFAMRGFGSVVTGTLVGGALSVGDAVEIFPGGPRCRVRGLQSHGAAAESVPPGARCAANLQGVEVGELARGQVVSLPGALATSAVLDVRLVWLDVAPHSPEDGAVAVEFLSGTAERRAHVAPIGAERLAPGRSGFARIHVEGAPVAVLPGDRFVLRGFSVTAMGGSTVGGGTILDVAPPRRRRSDPALRADLEALAARDPESDLRVRIRRAGLAGAERARLQRETGLAAEVLAPALARLSAQDAVHEAAGGVWLDANAVADLEARVLAALEDYHRAEPLRPGMPAGALRGALPENVPRAAADLAIARLASRGALVVERDLVRRSEHRPRLDPERKSVADRLLAEAREAGLEPPSLRDWSQRLGVASDPLLDLLAHLEREGRLVRATGDLWFDREAVDALRERVRAHLEEHGHLDTPAYKALIGTTRRTAVPLMELFDEERLTLRRGERRILRPGADAERGRTR